MNNSPKTRAASISALNLKAIRDGAHDESGPEPQLKPLVPEGESPRMMDTVDAAFFALKHYPGVE